MNQLLKRAPDMAKNIMRMHYCEQNVEGVIACMDPSITWIGCGEEEFSADYQEITGMFRQAAAQGAIPRCEIQDEDYQIVYNTEDSCVVSGRCRIRTLENSRMLLSVHQRITFVFHIVEEQLKLVHIHASNPYSELMEGEYFPETVGRETYQYLEAKIKEKTEQLDMMLSHMAGGMKGSLDDDLYTFFYVSESLCSMLGYTYDEYMEVSGGSAVGAVYPPDLKQALDEVEECFSKGDSYSTEYRIAKKDGTLLWVMDFGRKFKSDSGKTLINSYITDITQKKNMQKALHREQERYRIAMENSADILFEYDIREDQLRAYENKEGDDGTEVVTTCLKKFREAVADQNIVHQADRQKVWDILNGRNIRASEIRIKFPGDPEGYFRWSRVQGSPVYENLAAVRVVGTIRDISREKEKEEENLQLQEICNFAMSNDYEHICLIDLDTGRYEIFTQKGKRYYGLPHKGDYNELIYYLSEYWVCEQDKESYVNNITMSALVRRLNSPMEDNTFYYRSKQGSEFRWKAVQVVYFKNSRNSILMSERDIQNIKMAEQKEVMFNQSLDIAMKQIYEEVFQVNLTRNQCMLIRCKDRRTGSIFRTRNYTEVFERMACYHVPEEETALFRKRYSRVNMMEFFTQGNTSLYYEGRMLGTDGQYHWIATVVVPVENKLDMDILVMGFSMNIDVRKKKELEEEEYKKVLQEALEMTRKASKAKSEFLSRMSHDIRTPMNGIIGMTDIAKVSLDQKEKVADCLNKIETSAQFLLSLINDVLDMSRIESGKLVLTRKRFDFSRFVEGIITIVAVQAQEKNIRFDTVIDEQLDEVYIGDSLRLNQIIINLLSNAVKFTGSGGKIRLSIHQLERNSQSAKLRFVVADTGIGMSRKFVDKMYLPFEQENWDITKQYGGTGLGLSITKNLVGLMEGTIDVQSEQGEGTIFTIDIPMGIAQDAKTEALIKNAGYDFHNERILLVEDNELNMEIARTILEVKGLLVETAVNGQEAVDIFTASRLYYYDAVLMDILMPVKNGLEAAREIRGLNREDAAVVPIVAMSANAFQEDVEKSLECGMNEHLTKPVNVDVLYDTLGRLFLYSK